jgi:imidazolonepropionase-like amidohydrolase
MYRVNPRLLRIEDEIGTLLPGAHADIVLSQNNPLDDMSPFAKRETALSHVFKGGDLISGPPA